MCGRFHWRSASVPMDNALGILTAKACSVKWWEDSGSIGEREIAYW